MTTFKLLCDRCGLSQREAAAYLNSRLDTVKAWWQGRRNAPHAVLTELRVLNRRQRAAATDFVAGLDPAALADGAEALELALGADDVACRKNGWPCVGAEAAVIGMVAADLDVMVVVTIRD